MEYLLYSMELYAATRDPKQFIPAQQLPRTFFYPGVKMIILQIYLI